MGITPGNAPEYARIVSDVRRKITAGELAAGQKLPSESGLREHYGVSNTTARRAIQELRAAGLVVSQQGRGVFVRDHRPLVRVAPWRYWRQHPQASWIQEAETAGRLVDVTHETAQVSATEQLADRLGIDPGEPAVQTRYVIRMDGEPVSSSTSWEPGELTIGTDIADPHAGEHADAGIVPRFDSIGYRVTDVQEDVAARMPTTEEAQRLAMSPGVPLFLIAQIFRAGDRVVEVADIAIPADRYTLSFRMDVR